MVNPQQALQDVGVQTGDVLSAVYVHLPRLASTTQAFAAWCQDTVTTWGESDAGGDCSSVKDRLVNVQQIQGTRRAFAAVLSNGSVITWGSPEYGGDSSAVQDQLVNVQEIQAANSAFAAIRTDAGMFEVIVCCCNMFSDLR